MTQIGFSQPFSLSLEPRNTPYNHSQEVYAAPVSKKRPTFSTHDFQGARAKSRSNASRSSATGREAPSDPGATPGEREEEELDFKSAPSVMRGHQTTSIIRPTSIPASKNPRSAPSRLFSAKKTSSFIPPTRIGATNLPNRLTLPLRPRTLTQNTRGSQNPTNFRKDDSEWSTIRPAKSLSPKNPLSKIASKPLRRLSAVTIAPEEPKKTVKKARKKKKENTAESELEPDPEEGYWDGVQWKTVHGKTKAATPPIKAALVEPDQPDKGYQTLAPLADEREVIVRSGPLIEREFEAQRQYPPASSPPRVPQSAPAQPIEQLEHESQQPSSTTSQSLRKRKRHSTNLGIPLIDQVEAKGRSSSPNARPKLQRFERALFLVPDDDDADQEVLHERRNITSPFARPITRRTTGARPVHRSMYLMSETPRRRTHFPPRDGRHRSVQIPTSAARFDPFPHMTNGFATSMDIGGSAHQRSYRTPGDVQMLPPPSQYRPERAMQAQTSAARFDPFPYMTDGVAVPTDIDAYYQTPPRQFISPSEDTPSPQPLISTYINDHSTKKKVNKRRSPRTENTYSHRVTKRYIPSTKENTPLDDGVTYHYAHHRPRRFSNIWTESYKVPFSNTNFDNSPHHHHTSGIHHQEHDSATAQARSDKGPWPGQRIPALNQPSPAEALIKHSAHMRPLSERWQFEFDGCPNPSEKKRKQNPQRNAGPEQDVLGQANLPRLNLSRNASTRQHIDTYISNIVGPAVVPITETKETSTDPHILTVNKRASHKTPPQRRRTYHHKALDDLSPGRIREIQTSKYEDMREVLRQKAQRTAHPIDSQLIKEGTKATRRAALDNLAGRPRKHNSNVKNAQINRKKTNHTMLLPDSNLSEDISFFTASVRPSNADKRSKDFRIPQLNFTETSPPPSDLPHLALSGPRPRQGTGGAQTTCDAGDRGDKEQTSVTQIRQVRPAPDSEMIGTNLPKARSDRLKRKLKTARHDDDQHIHDHISQAPNPIAPSYQDSPAETPNTHGVMFEVARDETTLGEDPANLTESQAQQVLKLLPPSDTTPPALTETSSAPVSGFRGKSHSLVSRSHVDNDSKTIKGVTPGDKPVIDDRKLMTGIEFTDLLFKLAEEPKDKEISKAERKLQELKHRVTSKKKAETDPQALQEAQQAGTEFGALQDVDTAAKNDTRPREEKSELSRSWSRIAMATHPEKRLREGEKVWKDEEASKKTLSQAYKQPGPSSCRVLHEASSVPCRQGPTWATIKKPTSQTKHLVEDPAIGALVEASTQQGHNNEEKGTPGPGVRKSTKDRSSDSSRKAKQRSSTSTMVMSQFKPPGPSQRSITTGPAKVANRNLESKSVRRPPVNYFPDDD